MDTPFSQQSYTAQLIEEQQARTLTDVLKSDAAIQVNRSSSYANTDFSIRGFPNGEDDVLFNGLGGIAPLSNSLLFTESIDRVEVLRGPAAGLIGAGGKASTGGTVNLVPKRAGDTPLTRVTADYATESRVGGHLDASRRFGESQRYGVRFNAAYRDGDTEVDRNAARSGLAALALDYRGDRFRAALDLGYQNQDTHSMRRLINVAAGVDIPGSPDSDTNVAQPWEYTEGEGLYGTLSGEYDLNQQLTLFGAIGHSAQELVIVGASRKLSNADGTLDTGNAFTGAIKRSHDAFDGGLRARFETGLANHQVTLGYNWLNRDFHDKYPGSVALPASNIYQPVFGAGPASSSIPDPDDNPRNQNQSRSSVALSDVVSIYDERVHLLAGVRYQTVEAQSFNTTTGAVTSTYDERATTPVFGLLVKPWSNTSLYASYSEALQQGPTAPASAANAGETLSPFVHEQYEIGAKQDFGKLALTAALFQITQASAYTDPVTNIFGADGEERHRGIELNLFGELQPGLRVLSGVMVLDGELTQTLNGVNEGNKTRVVPLRVVAGLDWDAPWVTGLTFSTLVQYNGAQYIDPANLQKLPGYTVMDAGVRYLLPGQRTTTVRLNVNNLFDANEWAGTTGGAIGLIEPRTVTLSVSMDF
jgi:iron complex outermembrane receptor protein